MREFTASQSFRLRVHYLLTPTSIMAQVFVVVAAGSVIAFIIRDIGEAAVAGWIIQVRLASGT